MTWIIDQLSSFTASSASTTIYPASSNPTMLSSQKSSHSGFKPFKAFKASTKAKNSAKGNTLISGWDSLDGLLDVLKSYRFAKIKMRGLNFVLGSLLRFISVITFFMILSVVRCSKIVINQNGGYEEVVVSIGKEVPPIACPQLIQNIQGLLTSSSEYLRRATDGRVYFHRVTIVVPPTWDHLACGRFLPLNSFTSRSTINDAAVRIGTEHPIFGNSLWTQQSRSCGLPGDFISMGYHTILQFNETENVIGGSESGGRGGSFDMDNGNGYDGSRTTTSSSRSNPPTLTDGVFVKEWAKYRYGVFDEIGFANDPIYPFSYEEFGDRKVTSCTNQPIRGTWSPGCDKSENNASCSFSPSTSHENDRLTSSIMSFPRLKNVRMFCDQNNHNAKAPTKHNFICEGKSTSEVIYAHPDFKNLAYREPNVPVPPPEFIVKQLTTPRFVLLVEETGNMNLRDVWKFLKLAVRKFIKYDLASGTEIGVISVNANDMKVLSNMTSLNTITLRRALADKLPNYPNVDSGGNISLRRGIFHAVQMLKNGGGRAAGSVIILVSQGTVSTPDLDLSLELLKREEVTLAAIEYPSLGDGKISVLAEGTNGPHFAIRETGVGPTTHMSTFVQLINALMTIQRFFTKDLAPNWPVMIHESEYKGDSRSYVEANFSFESSASQTPAEFFIYTSNPNDPKINSVELTSPNGLKYTTQLSDLHDINVIKIDALINEPGVWRYRIERLADSHQSHFVQVLTKTSLEDLSVRLYTNVDMEVVANLSATPLILYVEVKHNKQSPVTDADVEAEVVAGNKKWTIKLLDNGNGDADVTGGDGVYSRYFIVPSGVTSTQLHISARIVVNPYRARYTVVNQPTSTSSFTSQAHTASTIYNSNSNNNSPQPCCGSHISPNDPKHQYKIVPFGERRSNSLKIRISDIPLQGFYTPGRIGDLKLVSNIQTTANTNTNKPTVSSPSRNITLTWTAPGEDLDLGVPASYQIFYSPDRVNENWAILSEFKADIEAGVEDNATVTLPYFGSFLVAIRAVDFYAKPSKMSNVIKVVATPPLKKNPSNSLSFGGEISPGGSTLLIRNTTPSPKGDFSGFDLMLILICGAAFVLLLPGVICILFFCRRVGSSRKNKNNKNSSDTKIAAITDPKSPIHWSASELLSEHDKHNINIYGGNVGGGGQCVSTLSTTKSDHGIANNLEREQKQNSKQNNIPGSNGNLPMHLNIMPSEYGGTNSISTRSRSSPDSYDDPDSPTPIPVSVRHTPRPSDFSMCLDTRNIDVEHNGSYASHHPVHNLQNVPNSQNVHSHHPQPPPPPSIHHHHQHVPYHQQMQQYQTQSPLQHNGTQYCNSSVDYPGSNNSNTARFSIANSSSPLPPPPLPKNLNSQHQQHGMMQYDLDNVKGSSSSVNSKQQRNITMV